MRPLLLPTSSYASENPWVSEYTVRYRMQRYQERICARRNVTHLSQGEMYPQGAVEL